MRNAKWCVGFVLGCAWAGVAVAADTIAPGDLSGAPRAAYESDAEGRQRPQRMQGAATRDVPVAPQASLEKTREEVKLELAAARASGCMDGPDHLYPLPCPLPDVTRSVADAFELQ